jgi:multiple sugar transport system substrate-binding protein
MNKRLIFTIVSMIIMFSMLASCSSPAAPAAPAGQPTQAAAAAAPAAADTAAPKHKVTLVVAGDGGNNQVQWTWFKQEMEEEFDVNLEIVGLSFDDLYTKLKTEFVAGSGAYDIVVFFPKHLGDFVANGYILPITSYLNAGPGADMEDIVPRFRDLYSKVGNDYYTLPYDGDILALFYRTDLFSNADEQAAFKAKYGYDLKPPETWEQYHQVAEFFTRKKGDKLAGQALTDDFYGTATYGQKDFQYAWYLNYAASMGVKYFDADMKPGINSDAAVKALEMYKQELKYCPPETQTYGFDQLQAIFLQGKTAMEIQWTDPGRVGQNPQISTIVGKIGTALVPGTKTGDKVFHAPVMAAGRVIGITKWAKDPAKAYQVARFMADEASLAYVSSPATGQDPFRYSHYKAVGAFEMFPTKKDAEDYLNGIKANLENGFPELNMPGTEQYYSALAIGISTYFSSPDADAKKTLDDVAKQWEDITNTLGRDKQKEIYLQLNQVWKEAGISTQ